MRKLMIALALCALGACSKHSHVNSPSNTAYGSSTAAPKDRSTFGKFWNAMGDAGGDVVDAGEWVGHKTKEGAIVVWHGTKKVAGKVETKTSDAAILTAVKSRFAADSKVSATDIDVDVSHGNVTLKGRVDSRAEAGRAIQIALDTRGVDRVTSYLVYPGFRATRYDGKIVR